MAGTLATSRQPYDHKAMPDWFRADVVQAVADLKASLRRHRSAGHDGFAAAKALREARKALDEILGDDDV
jgi:hypothetical protein